MRVVATPDVGTLVRERGGKLYMWLDAKACSGGALRLLLTAAGRSAFEAYWNGCVYAV